VTDAVPAIAQEITEIVGALDDGVGMEIIRVTTAKVLEAFAGLTADLRECY